MMSLFILIKKEEWRMAYGHILCIYDVQIYAN